MPRSPAAVAAIIRKKKAAAIAVAELEGIAGPTRVFARTEKQLRFIDEWAAGNSVFAASQRAGYTDGGSAAYQLVKHPEVLALYTQKVRALEVAGDMSRAKFMGMLQEAYDMAKMQAEPMTMVAAAREIGKACGYFAPVEKKITVNGNVVLDKMNKMTDTELLELLQHPVQAVIEQTINETAEEDDHDDAQALERPAERHSGSDATEIWLEDARNDDRDAAA